MQRFRANQYSFTLVAGEVHQLVPANARRAYLAIFNNSANELNVQFGRDANNPSDMVLPGFDSFTFDEKVPMESVNFYSAIGGVVVVIEGNPEL